MYQRYSANLPNNNLEHNAAVHLVQGFPRICLKHKKVLSGLALRSGATVLLCLDLGLMRNSITDHKPVPRNEKRAIKTKNTH